MNKNNSVKDRFDVIFLKNKKTYEWILNKHYAKRLPIINFAFGLVDKNRNEIVGVCTYGTPASRFNLSKKPYELNRLCVNDDLPKNTLSYFVSKTLKMLPKDLIIVSYADKNMNHHGYIYQATNWIYTGMSSAEKLIYINGKLSHRKAVYNMYGTSSIKALEDMGLKVETVKQEGKYRYFFVTGKNKELIKEIKDKYKEMPYPKGDNERYDASYTCKDVHLEN